MKQNDEEIMSITESIEFNEILNTKKITSQNSERKLISNTNQLDETANFPNKSERKEIFIEKKSSEKKISDLKLEE